MPTEGNKTMRMFEGSASQNKASGGLAARFVVAIVCVALATLSFFVLSNYFSSPDAYSHEIEQLDNTKITATELSIASATASSVVSLIPSDIGTPIANQLAAISKDLALVTGAILLEKYALTILGYALFGCIAPACLIGFAVCSIMNPSSLLRRQLIVSILRVLIASFIIWGSIPFSVKATELILDTYDTTISMAIQDVEAVAGDTGGDGIAKTAPQNAEDSNAVEEEASSGWSFGALANAITDTADGIAETLGNAAGSVANLTEDKVSLLIAWAKVVLTQITEGFAVLVVTTCVIPILIPVLMIWLIKLFFQPSFASISALPFPREE